MPVQQVVLGWIDWRYREQARLPQGISGVHESCAHRRSSVGAELARDSGGPACMDIECTSHKLLQAKTALVARELAPARVRSARKSSRRTTGGSASQPSGSKLPRHKSNVNCLQTKTAASPAAVFVQSLTHAKRDNISCASLFWMASPSLRTSPRMSRAPSLSPMSM